MTPPEHHIRCLAPLTKSGGDEEVRLEIDDKPVGVRLRIGRLNEQLVAGLPDRAFDLLEIAAVVYGADAAVSRGGPVDQQMGRKWHRRFIVDMPVRDRDFWARDDVTRLLEETLMFLSGDRFEFGFSQKRYPEAERSKFFKFDAESSWKADRVLMFSGGLDSFAGALEEIAEQRQRVALVSHFSASKIAPVQRNLHKALIGKFGGDFCRHVPVQVQMKGRSLKEGTHRSRSFLFAVLGAITAQAFEQNRVSFHENGVVSLNLPPVNNVVGTRATRTTHPQTLTRFTGFFAKVFEKGMRIDNPLFWRTKTDVVKAISRLGMNDHIAHTRSCADVHNQTKQHVHCGRCSQCIDRRFAMLAAGLTQFDPEEAYKVALMDDARNGAIDREVALSYVRNAQVFEHMTPEVLERTFPAVLDAVGHLDYPPATALTMIADLLNRHGASVSGVMHNTFDSRDADSFPEGSLPRLYGDVQRQALLAAIPDQAAPPDPPMPHPFILEVDTRRRRITIDDRVTFERNATASLLIELATLWLTGVGQGLPPLDYPFLQAAQLAQHLELASDEALRRRVMRARSYLRQRFASSGLDEALGGELIENNPWQGYRLAPDRVIVRKIEQD
ncbi:hypothetical protein XM53_06690 [Roseovarius atlanticus]|uniref:7-cyano-7-deazaguanine synthase n=1 Tax=Roseovarius atlanticus TaxID=1641875 RepID=A0A0T5NXP9_9RHOB|nr:hypothetical protein XM53_06690 [Roseovarius atlanticus]